MCIYFRQFIWKSFFMLFCYLWIWYLGIRNFKFVAVGPIESTIITYLHKPKKNNFELFLWYFQNKQIDKVSHEKYVEENGNRLKENVYISLKNLKFKQKLLLVQQPVESFWKTKMFESFVLFKKYRNC